MFLFLPMKASPNKVVSMIKNEAYQQDDVSSYFCSLMGIKYGVKLSARSTYGLETGAILTGKLVGDSWPAASRKVNV
jgi:hypothetical protein